MSEVQENDWSPNTSSSSKSDRKCRMFTDCFSRHFYTAKGFLTFLRNRWNQCVIFFCFRVQESDIHLTKVFIYFSNHWSPLDILHRLRLRSNNATAWKRQKLGLSWPHAISGHFRQSFSCRGSEEVATDRDGSPWEAFWLPLGQDSSPYLRNVLYIYFKTLPICLV